MADQTSKCDDLTILHEEFESSEVLASKEICEGGQFDMSELTAPTVTHLIHGMTAAKEKRDS